jgi:prolyl oligopeptidase
VAAARPEYPPAHRAATTLALHGQQIADPYRWLEDADDPATRHWLDGQQDWYAANRARWSGLPGWQRLLAATTDVPLVAPPQVRGARAFLSRREPGAEHAVLLLREDGRERSLIDPLALDSTGALVVEGWYPSLEGDRLAYLCSRGGDEESELRVIDVATGAVVDGPIDRCRGTGVAWLPGGQAFYFIRREDPRLHPGEERYHRRVRLHHIDAASDVEVFGRGRPATQFYTVALDPAGRWLTVTATAGTDPASEVWLADLHDSAPDQPVFRPVLAAAGARTRPRLTPPASGALLLLTDHQAPRGRLLRLDPDADRSLGRWRELVAERADAVLEEATVLAGPDLPAPLALLTWTRHGLSEVTVHNLDDGRQVGTVALPGPGIVNSLTVCPNGGPVAWIGYSDQLTPPTALRYDARTGHTVPEDLAGPATPARVATGHRRHPKASTVRYRSTDGTEVTLFVLSPAGRPDRARPAILTGYGGFGVSMVPGYAPHALAWARSGGIYAIAAVRGGREEGEAWHRAGMGQYKHNAFDDFAGAAAYLVDAGWTTPERLGILGTSNGGLLVGAAMTRHPDRYAAVVCLSPLLDMLRYELSGIGPTWRGEFGSVADPEQFRTLLSYSPYHWLRSGVTYPAVLFGVASADTRVDPLHARKMCAAMQYASTGPGPVLLRVEHGVGHGRRAASRQAGLTVDCLAFLGHMLGLDPATPW